MQNMKTETFKIPEIPNDKVVLLNISKSYHADKDTPPMFIRENVYEMTRKYWTVNLDIVRQAEYALGVADGIVVAVFTDLKWVYIECPYLTTMRKAFTGRPVPDSPYLGLDLSEYMTIRNPFRYVNIELLKR